MLRSAISQARGNCGSQVQPRYARHRRLVQDELSNSTVLHDLALELAKEWGLSENDMDMYFPPDQMSTQPPMMIVAATNPVKERIIGVCQPVTGNWTDQNGVAQGSEVGGGISFGVVAQHYLEMYEHKNPIDVAISTVQIKLLAVTQLPKHGQLTMEENDPYQGAFYRPDTGYFGKDRVEATVAVGKDIVRVVYNFVVQRIATDQIPPSMERKLCPKGASWKISGAAVESGDLIAGERPAGMNALLAAANQNLIFADLSGSLIGQTTGTGPDAQITLDTNAAGYGWFVDPTPESNEEFLPTSNPNEWVAKAGSDAAGKMDMLTVLQHEYGHALGLDHSADAHDFMASTLQPGVRRTLSVDEQLSLMRLAGYFPVPDSPNLPYTPNDPGMPVPFSRVVNTATQARMRRPRPGQGGFVSQFDTAANPKLVNTQFADGAGWAQTGDVAFGNNAATLTESTTMQTRLNQAFVVGPNDRFLSFKLADIALDDVNNAPDDAFEVALIDATTGQSLLGGTGLTHNDALLNLYCNNLCDCRLDVDVRREINFFDRHAGKGLGFNVLNIVDRAVERSFMHRCDPVSHLRRRQPVVVPHYANNRDIDFR